MMKFSFEKFLKLTFLGLVALLCWSPCVQAQPATNAITALASDVSAVQAPPKVWLTFGPNNSAARN